MTHTTSIEPRRANAMRILHVDNLQIRHYGRLRMAPGRTLYYGLLRNDWKVCEFSDRDTVRFESPLAIRPIGRIIANRRLLQMCENFRPELLIVEHCEIITNQTLREIRAMLPGVRIAVRESDPLWMEHSVARMRSRLEVADAFFTVGAGPFLKEFCNGRNVVAYAPFATDASVEDMDNSTRTEFEHDVIFCGVGDKTDDRYSLVARLHEALRGKMRFDSYGMHGHGAVWGAAYDQLLATSKMGMNFSRFEGWPLYFSDRLPQLVGNGLLTCVWDKGEMRRLLGDEHVLYFKDEDELVKKLLEFQNDDARRRAVAAAGRAFYHKEFNSRLMTSFMIEVTFGLPLSHNYLWGDEIYR